MRVMGFIDDDPTEQKTDTAKKQDPLIKKKENDTTDNLNKSDVNKKSSHEITLNLNNLPSGSTVVQRSVNATPMKINMGFARAVMS